jgi:hypothetical protein
VQTHSHPGRFMIPYELLNKASEKRIYSTNHALWHQV